MPFQQLTMRTAFSHNFWLDRVNRRDPQTYLPYVMTKDPRLYQIWNEKLIMVHETALLNPFATEHFVWLDAGYFRFAPVNGTVVRYNITAHGLQPHQMMFQNVEDCQSLRYILAGGTWGGSSAADRAFYRCYWQVFWFMVKHQISCVGVDQYVIVHMCKSFPETCSIHQSETSGDWFRLGMDWWRDSNYDFSRSRVVLDPHCPIQPGTTFPINKPWPLATGTVKFPQQFPVK
jgi:hypothetical protein